MNAKPRAIVVTGTPGTGKTEFSKKLSKKIGYKYLDLNQFLIENGCYTGFDSRRKTYVINVDLGRKMFLEKFKDGKYVVESHISHLIIPKKLVEICFVLRASPYVLIERLRSKMEEDKAIENCSAEILDIVLSEALNEYGPELVCELDTTSESVEKIVDRALRIIKGKEEKKIRIVNWLRLVYERGDLSKFFK